jgi:sugar lactone lactonase YvrE
MAKRTGGFIGQDGINAPDPATGVTGTAGDGQVTVSWTAPNDVGGAGITGYNVQTGSGLGPDSMVQEVDLGSGSYDSKEYSVARNDISMKADGTKWIGKTLAGVFYSYSMSTAFDITTSSQTSTIDLGSDTGSSAQGLHVKPDGTKFYVIDLTNTRVLQFAMSSAWDVSTASYESKLFNLSSQESSPRDITFSEDGTKMYAVGIGSDAVFQYTLSSAWDVSTASYASKSLDVSSEDTAPIGLDISRNGKNLVVGGAAGNDVNQYNLTTAFDVSTGSYSSTISTMNNGYFPALAGETSETTKLYVTSNNVIRQYSVGGSFPNVTSPFTFTGLTNGTSYTFNVWAINPFGWSSPSDASGGVSPAAALAVFIAGYNGGYYNTIDYVNISTTGNAADWGDLPYTSGYNSSCASSTRGITAGNNIGSGKGDKIAYITFSSTGNAVNFGDMLDDNSAAQTNGPSGNSTRGLLYGLVYYIQYVTMATTGNSLDFGDPITISSTRFASLSSPTRTIMAGSGQDYGSNVIQYVTTATTGNGTDFGDLQAAIGFCSGAGNDTRGLIMGGYGSSPTFKDTIQYVTIASTGNSTDFGDLISGLTSGAATSSGTRAVYAGGEAASPSNVIQSVQIASTGNATDFGDLTVTRYNLGSVSNVHGGLS